MKFCEHSAFINAAKPYVFFVCFQNGIILILIESNVSLTFKNISY